MTKIKPSKMDTTNNTTSFHGSLDRKSYPIASNIQKMSGAINCATKVKTSDRTTTSKSLGFGFNMSDWNTPTATNPGMRKIECRLLHWKPNPYSPFGKIIGQECVLGWCASERKKVTISNKIGKIIPFFPHVSYVRIILSLVTTAYR